jgi:hypothetical protein
MMHKETVAPVVDKLGMGTDSRHYDKRACRHALEHHCREAFMMRRLDDHRGPAVEPKELVSAFSPEEACERDRPGDALRARKRAQASG